MKLRESLWLTDENIPDQLVQYMRSEGITVQTVKERDMLGKSDRLLLETAYQEKRIILTQDSDFGTLVFTGEQLFWGIVYVRPGHFWADFHIQTLKAVLQEVPGAKPPFLIVAENQETKIKIRLREW